MIVRAFEVVEASQVAQARRAVKEAAARLGGDESACGRAALVATELATNLIKHASGGELLLGVYDDDGGTGLQLIALDRGPGIADVGGAMRDGYSTAGGAGGGLGAVRRLSQFMEIASWPGQGTVVLARLALSASVAREPGRANWACISIAKPGEEVCGDSADVADASVGRTVLVVDGLGHGPAAAAVSAEAIRLFRRSQAAPVTEILHNLHAGLRSTRGAAVAVARFEPARVLFGGIGNIAGALVAPDGVRRMVSLNGTAGHVAARIHIFEYPYSGEMVLLHTDGLSSRWSFDRYPGLTASHPALIAAVLCRDHWRRQDDVTVLVSRGAP
jgi:anti-sigma regulatory factor (Ser/Thr protein kinase)